MKPEVPSTPTPPSLRDVHDKEEESLNRSLTTEAAKRFRSTLGKLSWLSMTRIDVQYYVSMLARGQAEPLEKHERAMRMVLRCLKHISGFKQVMPKMETRICSSDASWTHHGAQSAV